MAATKQEIIACLKGMGWQGPHKDGSYRKILGANHHRMRLLKFGIKFEVDIVNHGWSVVNQASYKELSIETVKLANGQYQDRINGLHF